MDAEVETKTDVVAVFVYYVKTTSDLSRNNQIYKMFQGNFPPGFRLILIPTDETNERIECIYPRFIVADDFAQDLKDISDYLRKSLQLEGAEEQKKAEILKTLGYLKEPEEDTEPKF